MKEKVTAVVVTYNRKELLIRCIEHLRKQTVNLNSIIVINNGSSDGTDIWLNEQADLDVIHQENVGGSGGFYRGIQHAYEKGYGWIWCMDDDVYPEYDCLENLLNNEQSGIGILCPLRKQDGKFFLSEIKKFNLSNPFKSLHHDKVTVKDINSNDVIDIEGFAFEGPLIRKDVVRKIGLPNKDLFLLYDDSDYCYRAVLAGYKVKLVTDAILNKELFYANENIVEKRKKGKWKLYYHIRNTVYFNRKYGRNWFVRNLRSLAVLIEYESYILKNIFVNDKYEWNDFLVFFHAFNDGINGRLGKKVN